MAPFPVSYKQALQAPIYGHKGPSLQFVLVHEQRTSSQIDMGQSTLLRQQRYLEHCIRANAVKMHASSGCSHFTIQPFVEQSHGQHDGLGYGVRLGLG